MKALLVVILLAVSNATVAKEKSKIYTIKEAQLKGLIQCKSSSLGGHIGKCLQLRVTNKTRDEFTLNIPAGTVFDSEVQKEQDLMVTRSEQVVVAPLQNIPLLLNAMCIQAHNSGPVAEHTYKYIGMGDSGLVKVARYVSDHNLQNQFGQQLVWIISDKNAPESLSDGSDEQIREALTFLQKEYGLKGKPGYQIVYLQSEQQVFSGIPIKVKGKIDYSSEVGAYTTLCIQDEAGHNFAIVFYEKYQKPGTHKIPYEFRTKDIPPGNYYARLYANHKLVNEEQITF